MEEFDFDIRQNNEEESTLNYPLIIGLIVALLLIGGGIYWFVTRDNDDTDETQKEMVSSDSDKNTTTDADEPAAEKVIDSTDLNQNTEDTTASQDIQTNGDTEKTDNTTSAEKGTGTTSDASSSYDNSENIYFIVSGAFKDEANAQNKVGKLKAEGYNAVIAGQNAAGLFIVAYEGFSNIDDAKTKLAEVRQSHPQAWIYKRIK